MSPDLRPDSDVTLLWTYSLRVSGAALRFSQTKLYCALCQGMEPFHLCVRQYPCFSFALVLALLVLPVYVILCTLWELAFLRCLVENKLTYDFWQFGWYYESAPRWWNPELVFIFDANKLDDPFWNCWVSYLKQTGGSTDAYFVKIVWRAHTVA